MKPISSYKNRTLLWEELAPSEDSRSRPGDYSAQPESAPVSAPRPRLGFARRTTENLDPAFTPEPITLDEQDDDDFRPRRAAWWRPRTKTGRNVLLSASALALILLTVAGFFLRRHILNDPNFVLAASSNVQLTGASELSRDELLPVFQQDMGKNLFTIPISERRKNLEQVSWIQNATVMRVLPNQLRVNVTERTPIAFVRQTPDDPRVALVDADGVLLKMPAALMAQHHYSFPVVTGIDSRDPLTERRRRMAVYQRLIQQLDSGPTKYSAQISEIDLRDPSDARVLMPEPGGDVLAHFGSDNFLARFQTYEQHIAEWRQQMPRLAAVDLRYEQQVVLSPAKDSPHTTDAPKPEVSAQAAPTPQPAVADTKTADKQKPSPAIADAGNSAAKPNTGKPSAAKHTDIASSAPAPKASATKDAPQKKNASADKSRKPATKTAKKNTSGKNKKSNVKQKPAVKKTAAKPASHTAPATGQ